MPGIDLPVRSYRLPRAWAVVATVVTLCAVGSDLPDRMCGTGFSCGASVAFAIGVGVVLALPVVVFLNRVVAAVLSVAVAVGWCALDGWMGYPVHWRASVAVVLYALVAVYAATSRPATEEVAWLVRAPETAVPPRPRRVSWPDAWRWWFVAGAAAVAAMFGWFARHAQDAADLLAADGAPPEDLSAWYVVTGGAGALAVGAVGWIVADHWAVRRFFRMPQPAREVGVADVYNGVLVVGPLADPYWAVEIPVRPKELARHDLGNVATLYGEPVVGTWCVVVSSAGDVVIPTAEARKPALSLAEADPDDDPRPPADNLAMAP
ncbi:hypothetical protein GCM10009682_11580 [Luedemannella flava]|uniref:Integral membrane protein n=1 Tax=Luedemannella flava TaxID=349316 RepID=A0ABN2LLX7_9ACTN